MNKIVVAVSGGIDSMVMLHTCRYLWSDDTYIIAHVDHGIRDDSYIDAQLVETTVHQYGFTYETVQLRLGPHASEETARNARYQWLEATRQKHSADAVMTAHHQDDVLETICINLIRGTGWRGVASLNSSDQLRRPLLDTTKADIVDYALQHELHWRNDDTNEDMRLLRNYIRAAIIRSLTPEQRKKFIDIYVSQLELRHTIEAESGSLVELIKLSDGLSRHWLTMLESDQAYEVVVSWLGKTLISTDWHQLRRAIATARPCTNLQLGDGLIISFTKTQLVVYHRSI